LQCSVLTIRVQVGFKVTAQNLRPDITRVTHPELAALVQRCWETLPDNRPPFAVIVEELERLGRRLEAEGDVQAVAAAVAAVQLGPELK
jgi:hypothetical protein